MMTLVRSAGRVIHEARFGAVTSIPILSAFRGAQRSTAYTSTPPKSNRFLSVLDEYSQSQSELQNQKFAREFLESHAVKSANVDRTFRREFGPAAYGIFTAKNVKACRGVRGKSFSIRISQTKWRYPKRGRH